MEPLPQELQSLEQQLRMLVPQTPQTSPEQFLYQAGWEAALAQQAPTAAACPAASTTQPQRSRTNTYWAAACAALLLLSTALGWRAWQQPASHSFPITVITIAPTPLPSNNSPPMLAVTAPANERNMTRSAEAESSALVNYLELRQRVTRGGLSMWPVSSPTVLAPQEMSLTPARDWQAELLREAL
jgi:hypothetical protein